MKANSQNHCRTKDLMHSCGKVLLAAAVVFALQPAQAQNAQSQARMSQMLSQFEQGKRPTYSTGGHSMGRASGMPGYANMMGGRRPSNLGGYAGMGSRGGSSQMMQMMKQRMARMQSGGGGGGGSLLQMMRQRQGGAPNMTPGMGGGPGAGMGMQSGLFAKMMRQDASFNNNMRRNQMSQGMGAGMMGMRRPMPGGMGMSRMGSGMGMSGMGIPGMGMSKSGMGMPGGTSALLGRMGQQRSAPRVGSPFAPKPAAPAKSGTLSDLEKQMESQYGK